MVGTSFSLNGMNLFGRIIISTETLAFLPSEYGFVHQCEVKVARKDLAEHVANTCVWKISKCHHCKEHVSQCQMEVKPN